MIRTPRLVLRDWCDSDLEPFAAMNAHAEVMRYFSKPLSRAESDAFAGQVRDELTARGYGLWAVESPGEAPFLGFVGLHATDYDTPFTPCIEIGWRLAWRFWNKGYASEAATAVLAHAFGALGLREVVSFTAAANTPSQRVMEKIGMQRDPGGDFAHPKLPAGHWLSPHVLYRAQRATWRAGAGAR